MEIQFLEPFDNSTIIEEKIREELIFVNFISILEAGICMPSNIYVHDAAKEAKYGQIYVERYTNMKLRMHWCSQLSHYSVGNAIGLLRYT
jgi:hypothetical protein